MNSSQPKESSILFLLGSWCRRVQHTAVLTLFSISLWELKHKSLLASMHNQEYAGGTHISKCGALVRAHFTSVANGISQAAPRHSVKQDRPGAHHLMLESLGEMIDSLFQALVLEKDTESSQERKLTGL